MWLDRGCSLPPWMGRRVCGAHYWAVAISPASRALGVLAMITSPAAGQPDKVWEEHRQSNGVRGREDGGALQYGAEGVRYCGGLCQGD